MNKLIKKHIMMFGIQMFGIQLVMRIIIMMIIMSNIIKMWEKILKKKKTAPKKKHKNKWQSLVLLTKIQQDKDYDFSVAVEEVTKIYRKRIHPLLSYKVAVRLSEQRKWEYVKNTNS